MRPTFRSEKSETRVVEIEPKAAEVAFRQILFNFECIAERFADDSLDALPLRLMDFAFRIISIAISMGISN